MFASQCKEGSTSTPDEIPSRYIYVMSMKGLLDLLIEGAPVPFPAQFHKDEETINGIRGTLLPWLRMFSYLSPSASTIE